MTPQEKNELIRAIQIAKEKKADEIRVASPWVLGDTYEELVESLNQIAEAELRLVIVPPSMRRK